LNERRTRNVPTEQTMLERTTERIRAWMTEPASRFRVGEGRVVAER
jgi:hypothetical protein